MSNVRVLQQRLWRWHFWAGLMSLPLALILAISGGIYLFKHQYTHWYEQQLEQSLPEISSEPLATDQLLNQVQTQYPDSRFKRYTLARDNDRSVEFEMKTPSGPLIIWVDRYTGQQLHATPKHQQLMHWIKHLHGELTLGNKGSYVVEFMAQWMIVLIVIGLTLYLSRHKVNANGHWGSALKRALFPALKFGTPIFWRRLHGAIGIWLSLFILTLLITGLPWTQVWGNGFKQIQSVMGWDGPGQEWFVSLKSQPHQHYHESKKDDGIDAWRLSSSDDNRVTLQSRTSSRQSKTSNRHSKGMTLGQIETNVLPMNLAHPIVIMPPNNANGVWSVRSMTSNRPERVTLHYDRWTGEEIMSVRFSDYHPVKRAVSYGIALHEGALFGLPNLLLVLFTALGLVAIVISGGIMWWKRRPYHELGVPELLPGALPKSVWVVGIVLGVLLPLFAVSVLGVLILDVVFVRLFFRK